MLDALRRILPPAITNRAYGDKSFYRRGNRTLMNRFFSVGLSLVFAGVAIFSLAVAQDETSEPEQTIEAVEPVSSDAEIDARIDEIFAQIDSLQNVAVSVNAGVVTLTGSTTTADAADRAEALAARVADVVTVENEIERDVSVETRITPAVGQLQGYIDDLVRSLPLIALALVVFSAITFLGWLLSRWSGLWRKISPNAFIADLVATTIHALFVLFGAVAALSLLDATAILGAFLGAAGVLGLAVGFAVRDTMENYISSIMLSLRQPFRPNDYVKIDDREGHVIRLTSRATILMTPSGNHLRIPNSSVFKAVIINYSRNPERRFEFELGVDADDDPLAAIKTGLHAIKSLAFVLKEPAPLAFIKDVGDSNIVIFFAAWIDQREADFKKSRSVALSAAKDALEEAGFALPEPIYRLRFDASAPPIMKETGEATVSEGKPREIQAEKRKKQLASPDAEAVDVAPDMHIAEKVEEERREEGDTDLLSDDAPVE